MSDTSDQQPRRRGSDASDKSRDHTPESENKDASEPAQSPRRRNIDPDDEEDGENSGSEDGAAPPRAKFDDDEEEDEDEEDSEEEIVRLQSIHCFDFIFVT